MVHNMQQRSADGAPGIELQPHEIMDAQLAIVDWRSRATHAREKRTKWQSKLWLHCHVFDFVLHSVLSITCLSVRAVHLEMAWGLGTDTLLNAFTRFTSRREVPKEVMSDCGTNFVGAVNELKELCSQLYKEKIQRVMIDKGVKWIFNL